MTVYTVHEPPPHKDEVAAEPDRFVFVRDGFHFWAFVFGPIWMLWRGLWLVLLGYIGLMAVLQAALWAVGASGVVRFAVGILISLLVGFEAGTLRRFTLRKWRNVGVVVGTSQEDAERRFFDAWMKREQVMSQPVTQAPVVAAAPAPALRTPEPSTEVIGLFPEPEPRR